MEKMIARKLIAESLNVRGTLPEWVRVVRYTTRVSENPCLNSTGGDYDFGFSVLFAGETPLALLYWSSSDLEYCRYCGRFGCSEEHDPLEVWNDVENKIAAEQPIKSEKLGIMASAIAHLMF